MKSKQSTWNNKKQQTKNDKDKETSEEEIDSDVLMEDKSDDDIEYWEEIDPSGFEEVDQDPSLGDFVLVEVMAKKTILLSWKSYHREKSYKSTGVLIFEEFRRLPTFYFSSSSWWILNPNTNTLPPPLSLGATKRLQCTLNLN